MTQYTIRFTPEAEDDLLRLYEYLLEHSTDLTTAEYALKCIKQAINVLKLFPFTCRKATSDNSYLRELIIPFGKSGYVALFEIEPHQIVTILAVRHQLESDYH